MTDRRTFLSSLGLGAGGVYFTTFLNQLTATDAAPRPMRVVFFLQANGLYPNQIQPEGIDRPAQPTRLEDRPLARHRLPESLSPLEPFKDRLALVHGLSGRIAVSSHSTKLGCLGCYPSNVGAFDETIDSAVARRLPSLFPHIGLGTDESPATTINYNVSASGPNRMLPIQCQPEAAHRRLFGVALTGEARRAFDTRGNVLDFLAQDVRSLQSNLNSAERERLGYYLEAFESMNGRQSALRRIADRVSANTPRRTRNYGPEVHWMERLEAQFEIATGALIAGLTNVVTLASCSGKNVLQGTIDGAQIGLPAGAISMHGIGHGGGVPEAVGRTYVDVHVAIRKKHMEYLATMLQRLAAIPEGRGTMLDNTLVVYTSDYGESHHGKVEEWPFVLVGDLGGRLNTRGRYLRYPWYKNPGHRTCANLYTSLLRLVGDNRPRFGVPDPALRDLNQNGPLDELMA